MTKPPPECICPEKEREDEICPVHDIYEEPTPPVKMVINDEIDYTPAQQLKAKTFKSAWEAANAQGLKGSRTLEALAEVDMLEDKAWSMLTAAETIKQTGGAVEINGVRMTPLDEEPQPLPFSSAMSTEPPTESLEGLQDRYYVQRRGDATGKHTDCRYFVLDPKHDEFARSILFAYASIIADERPALAEDIFKWLEETPHAHDQASDDDEGPRLTHWPESERWKAPLILDICPGCLTQAVRQAKEWAIDEGQLYAKLECNIGPTERRRVWKVLLDLPETKETSGE